MKLINCNQSNTISRDIIVCDLLPIIRLRTVGEADPLNTSIGNLELYDYILAEEANMIYGEND